MGRRPRGAAGRPRVGAASRAVHVAGAMSFLVGANDEPGVCGITARGVPAGPPRDDIDQPRRAAAEGPGRTGPGALSLCAPATPARTSLGCLPDGSDESRCGPPAGGIRGCEGGPQSPSSLRAACGAPRARETRASPRKWRGRAESHALLQVFASYEGNPHQSWHPSRQRRVHR